MQLKNLNLQPADALPADDLSDLPSRYFAVMRVDLSSLAHNFQFLQSTLPHATCSAVVKADAYGLGMVQIAPTLASAGCRHFFVATMEEAYNLRQAVKDANIYLLGGLLPGCQQEMVAEHITPVLNDLGQIKLWHNQARVLGRKLPAIIHIDTGMWRLGLPPVEVMQLANAQDLLEPLDVKYFMSHLASSDSPQNGMNERQREAFDQALSMFPKTPASLANSHGIFLGHEYQYDLVRPGRSLFGLGARFLRTEGLQQALRVYARVLQVMNIGKGQSIGYDGTYTVTKPTRIATLAIGYADGYVRTLSNHGRVFLGGHQAPVVGRVSMDLITVDVGHIPEDMVVPGAWAEVIGEDISADDVAMAAGTTSREISSKLGNRFHRIYA